MNKVKLKSYLELKELIKQGKVELISVSDSGEYLHLGIKDGYMTHMFSVYFEDFESEFQVTKLDNHISESQLERLRILFDD
jgi:predicted phosphoadenosine phosphosulfate sulfurtransferase